MYSPFIQVMGKLVCNVCKVYHTEILTDLMKHIRLFHSHKPNFSIKCGIGYGPLVRHWTMRYAAKHSYFKHLAQSMGNFINIEFSLATHHQLLQCCIPPGLPPVASAWVQRLPPSLSLHCPSHPLDCCLWFSPLRSGYHYCCGLRHLVSNEAIMNELAAGQC